MSSPSFTFLPEATVELSYPEVSVTRDADGAVMFRTEAAAGAVLFRRADPAALQTLSIPQELTAEFVNLADQFIADNDADGVIDLQKRVAGTDYGIDRDPSGNYRVVTPTFQDEIGGNGANLGIDALRAARQVLAFVSTTIGDAVD